METDITKKIIVRKRIPSKVIKYQYDQGLDQFEIEVKHDMFSSFAMSVQPCAVRFYNKNYYSLTDEMRKKYNIKLSDYIYFSLDHKRYESEGNSKITVVTFSKEKDQPTN